MNDPKTADALEADSVNNDPGMTADLNAGQGSLGKLLKDEAFCEQPHWRHVRNLKDLADRLNRGEGTAGKLLTDQSLFNQLNSVTKRPRPADDRLNDGEGTAGQLLKDKQLYENMNGTVGDLRTLIAAIQKDPRKYLNVKVSIF